MIALILAACVGAGIYALYRSNLERPTAEYHLFHGPASDCIECEGK